MIYVGILFVVTNVFYAVEGMIGGYSDCNGGIGFATSPDAFVVIWAVSCYSFPKLDT